MNIICSGYKALSGIYNLSKHISPMTGAMVVAAAAASSGVPPIPRILMLGGTLLGAYCNAKQDIQIGVLKNSLGNMNWTLQKLEYLTQQVESQVPGLKEVCNRVDGLIPQVDTRLSEQEMRLVRIGDSLQAIKNYHHGLKSLNSNLDNLHKGEIQLVEHVNHLDVLTKKEQSLKEDIGEQLQHWDRVVKELENCDGVDNQKLVQEIRKEIGTLIHTINEANTLKLREIKVLEEYNLSNPQERVKMCAHRAVHQDFNGKGFWKSRLVSDHDLGLRADGIDC